MERGRMRKYGHASPERSKTRSEPPPKNHHQRHHQQQQRSQQARRVPVVYYLCRNRHLEHPHFIEVPTSSPDGLCLRDVIARLNVLRGKGMAAMYSWSCKRSYKNGFVWHDLCEDDLILPANGNEYVLKGSELLDASPSDRSSQHAAGNGRSRASKGPVLQESPSPSSSRSQDGSPSSSAVVIPEVKAPPPPPSPVLPPPVAPAPDDELCCPNETSPKSKLSPASGAGGSSPSAWDYRVHTAVGATDASTQTEEAEGASRRGRQPRGTRAMVVERPPDLELEDHRRRNRATPPRHPQTCSEQISREEISLPPPPSPPSSGAKSETLESLIRAEVQKMNSFRILEEEELLAHTGTKLRPTNVFMQLITCGSLSVKGHHSFGLVPTYKARFSHANYYPSPSCSSSVMLGELHYPLKKSSRRMGPKTEKEISYGGSMVESGKHKEGGEEQMPIYQQHQSPYNAQSNIKSPEPNGCSERVAAHASSANGSSTRLESFHKDKEKVIKIEERLTSGARVIIQSRAPCEDSEDSSSP